LNTREEYIAWEQRCNDFIESLEELSRVKCPRLSIGVRQSLIARIAQLESLKDLVRKRFVHVQDTMLDSDSARLIRHSKAAY